MANPCDGALVRVTLSDGTTVAATSNHVFFARLAHEKKRQRMARPLFVNSVAEAGAAKFHGWDRDPLPATSEYSPGLIDAPAFETSPALKLLRGEWFQCIRAGNLCPGLLLPVYRDGTLAEVEVTAVDRQPYAGTVYDLTVPVYHNFIANGVVVHNSIYKWRGSDIKNILDFERDFPAAKVITLTQNYRSTKAILHAASTLIDRNKHRKKKTLTTANPQGESVKVLNFNTGLEEAEGVVERIKKTVGEGKFKYRDFAIFTRINALTRTLESAFVKHGVPFQIVKGLAFFERKENKDVLAYLRLLVNPNDTVSFLRAVNEPARGVGKTSLDRLVSYAERNEISLMDAAGMVAKIPEIKGKASTGLRDFYRMIAELRTQLEHPPHDLIVMVLDKSGYRKMLQDSTDEEDADRLANIEELVTAAKQFYDEDNSRTLADFLEQITLASDVDGWDEAADHVSVMTLHAAKGLEFPVVYMLATEQGLLPHERSLAKDDDVEEERRLCFVGMTRAMRELNLCHARLREFRGQAMYQVPSMFLDELPADVERIEISQERNFARSAIDEWRERAGYSGGSGVPGPGGLPRKMEPFKPSIGAGDSSEFMVGAVVQHDEYGIGQITDLSGFGALRRVKVRFPAAGEKTFVADKVKMKVVKRK
jgi:DNA helicase II / ATP-dependent DNA helicase PcrA